jgi:hypothetical protein
MGNRADLIEVRRDGDVKLLGYVAALAEQGPTRGPQNVFVTVASSRIAPSHTR